MESYGVRRVLIEAFLLPTSDVMKKSVGINLAS
jgi:hypothetical protein